MQNKILILNKSPCQPYDRILSILTIPRWITWQVFPDARCGPVPSQELGGQPLAPVRLLLYLWPASSKMRKPGTVWQLCSQWCLPGVQKPNIKWQSGAEEWDHFLANPVQSSFFKGKGPSTFLRYRNGVGCLLNILDFTCAEHLSKVGQQQKE